MILAPTQQVLTELTLQQKRTCWRPLTMLHLPHLCTLSLCHLVFDPSVGFESFILQHAGTLVRLELLMCKLFADPDTFYSASLSTALAPDNESSSRPTFWEYIWNSFAAEL